MATWQAGPGGCHWQAMMPVTVPSLRARRDGLPAKANLEVDGCPVYGCQRRSDNLNRATARAQLAHGIVVSSWGCPGRGHRLAGKTVTSQ